MVLPLVSLGSNTKQVAQIARKFIFYHHQVKHKFANLSKQEDTTSKDALLRQAIRDQLLKSLSVPQAPVEPVDTAKKAPKPSGAPILTMINRPQAFLQANQPFLRNSFKPKPDLEFEAKIEKHFQDIKELEAEKREELLNRMIPRILGLDIGSKFIGVAVSDRFGKKAQPLGVIHREIPTGERKFSQVDKKIDGQYMRSAGWVDVTRPLSPQELGDRIKRYADSFNVIGSVVGMPQDDSQGQIAVNEFITTQEYYGTFALDSTVYVSEDYSTVEGRQMAYDSNFRTGDDVIDNVDAFAAAVILQRFLDSTQEEFALKAMEYAELLKVRQRREIQALPIEINYDWDFEQIEEQKLGVDLIDHEQDERDADYTYDSTKKAEEPALRFYQKKALRKWRTQAKKAFKDEIKSAKASSAQEKADEEENLKLELQAQLHREEMQQKEKFRSVRKMK